LLRHWSHAFKVVQERMGVLAPESEISDACNAQLQDVGLGPLIPAAPSLLQHIPCDKTERAGDIEIVDL